jgi:hypothetical protein
MRLTFALCMLSLAACTQLPDAGTDGPHSLSELKARGDNYISTNAREFTLTGVAHSPLPTDFDEIQGPVKDEMVERAVNSRLSHVSRSIKRHIDGKLRTANGGTAGEDDTYFTFVRRNDAITTEQATVVSGNRVEFRFQLELVGSVRLMHQLAPGSAARRTFAVTVSDHAGADPELVTVEIEGSPARDAFPRYDVLFEDGVFDMGIHFGGDYNQERFDLETAKWLVELLVEDGWTNPGVTSFDDLTIDSGPFVRSVSVEGRDVEVRIFISHSDMVETADEARLTEVMERSFATRDIVMYSGHAGENSGFILDYQPRHEIKARDFAAIPMAEKYQIFILDGCRTYRTYVQALMANPYKSYDNVDIVTTVNTTPFSAGFQLLYQFVYWMTLTNDDGAHFPLSWKAILRGVNTRTWKNVHYGVHGTGDNPQLNPYASEGVQCTPCTVDADCKAGGNLCLGYPGGSACGVACTNDLACGDGYRCARLVDDPKLFHLPKQCVRRDYACP